MNKNMKLVSAAAVLQLMGLVHQGTCKGTVGTPSDNWDKSACKNALVPATCGDNNGFNTMRHADGFDYIQVPSSSNHTFCYVSSRFHDGGWGIRTGTVKNDGKLPVEDKNRKCAKVSFYYYCSKPAVVIFEAELQSDDLFSDSFYVVHDNSDTDLSEFDNTISTEIWDWKKTSKAKAFFPKRHDKSHTVWDSDVHSITLLEREDGPSIKSLKIHAVGGMTECSFGLPPKTTTAATTTNPALSDLDARLDRLEDGTTKDAIESLKGAISKLEQQFDGLATTLSNKVELLSTAQQKQAGITSDRISKIELAITAAINDVAAFGDTAGTQGTCTKDCEPTVGAEGNDLVMRARGGRALVTTGTCGDVDLCGLAQTLQSIIKGLKGDE